MHIYLFKQEFVRVMKQKKNYFLIIALLCLTLMYIFLIMPNRSTMYTFDEQQVEQNVKDLASVIKGMEMREGTGVGLMIGPAYAINVGRYEVERSLVYAYKDQSYDRFLRLYLMNMHNLLPEKIEPLVKDSPYSVKDSTHKFTQTQMMYESYLKENHLISGTMIEQTTSLQSVYHFTVSSGVFFLLFLAIYFSSDVLVKDRQHKSILQGLPISWYCLINIKSAVAILYTLFIIFILTSVAVLAIGIQNGFGSLALNIPTISGEYDPLGANYDMISLLIFFSQSIIYLFLFIVLFTRLNMIFSLLVKNIWIVLMFSTIVLFAEQLYLTRTSRELFGIDLALFPQTYFDFGNVITGERMFLLNTDTITYSKGLLVVGLTVIAVEILLRILCKKINTRRFYQA